MSALVQSRGGDVHPLNYRAGLARADVMAVDDLRPDPGGIFRGKARWRIDTPRATVRADKVLIATNGFSDDLWPGLKRTIVPLFSSIAATAPLPDSIAREIMPTRSVLYESGHITVYYRIDTSNRLLMGGRGPMYWISDPNAVAYLMRYAEQLWPALAGHRLDPRLE